MHTHTHALRRVRMIVQPQTDVTALRAALLDDDDDGDVAHATAMPMVEALSHCYGT